MEERSGGSDTDSEIMRLRERKEELEKARRTEAARARKAQREILNEVELFVFCDSLIFILPLKVVSVSLHIRPRTLVLDTNILVSIDINGLLNGLSLTNFKFYTIRLTTFPRLRSLPMMAIGQSGYQRLLSLSSR